MKEDDRKTVRRNYRFSPEAVQVLESTSTLLGVSETAIIEILVTEGSAGLQRRIEARRDAIGELLAGLKPSAKQKRGSAREK